MYFKETCDNNIELSNYDPLLYSITNWDDLDVDNDILRGIYAYGFEKPSPIQKKAIKPLFEKKDIIAQAQSGTGKTACFAIGSLQLIDADKSTPQVIILSPTRELSIQSKNVVDALGNQFSKLKTQLLIGGTSTEDDIKQLVNTPPQIIIGCPGRVHDMLKRGKLNKKDLKTYI
jgi:superfamily II DNA/RNA helicase